jgi:hypothetical protein
MYQRHVTVTADLTQQQLLHLMLLADRYEVPRVMAATAAAFAQHAAPPHHLEWSVVLQLLDLPPSCAGQPAFEPVQQLAVARLQQVLGDLEEVWAQQELGAQLMRLPFNGMLQLLQHPGTRVSSENTVVHSIRAWVVAQELHCREQPSNEQLQQLMHLVRVRHCTPHYARTIMAQMDLVRSCFTASELGLLREVCSPGGYALLSAAGCPALHNYPAWYAEQRPVSARRPVIEWALPLATLQAAVQQQLSSNSRNLTLAGYDGTTYVVQGQVMRMGAAVRDYESNSTSNSTAGSGARHLAIDLFAQLLHLPPDAVHIMSARFSVECYMPATADAWVAAAAVPGAAAAGVPPAWQAAAGAAAAEAQAAAAAALHVRHAIMADAGPAVPAGVTSHQVELPFVPGEVHLPQNRHQLQQQHPPELQQQLNAAQHAGIWQQLQAGQQEMRQRQQQQMVLLQLAFPQGMGIDEQGVHLLRGCPGDQLHGTQQQQLSTVNCSSARVPQVAPR